MATKPCPKCGKEVDTRGIRMHIEKCKGTAPEQKPAQPAQTGTSIKSEIKIKKPAQPAQKAQKQEQPAKPAAKKKGFWASLLEDDGDDIL